MLSFPTGFKNYACIGDAIDVSVGDVTVTATIEFDDTSKPSDYDCYREPDVERWRQDEWFYCGIVLSIHVDGVVVSKHEESLWGIEVNFGDNNDYLTQVANDMLRRVQFDAIARQAEHIADSLHAAGVAAA